MPDQTPVQIAWVTRDLDATEKALTSLLGAKKWDVGCRRGAPSSSRA